MSLILGCHLSYGQNPGQPCGLVLTTCTTCTQPNICTNCTCQSPVPILLLYFDVWKADDGIWLKWVTASEINNDGFTIERSYDGQTFNVVGSSSGAGNSTRQLDYLWLDSTKQSGHIYYRLWQTDFDGKKTMVGERHTLAEIVKEITWVQKDRNLFIRSQLIPDMQTTVSIYNHLGVLIVEKELFFRPMDGLYEESVALPHLNGIYLVCLNSGVRVIWKKIVVTHT